MVKVWSFLMIFCGMQCIIGCSSQKTSAQQAGMQMLHLEDSLAQQTFVMDANRMFPLRVVAQGLVGGYHVQLKGGRMQSILPYRGRAYRSSMNSGAYGPLHFEAQVTNYRISSSRKKHWRVEMDVRNNEELFHYAFRIAPDGFTHLKVSSSDRDWIVFEGYLRNSHQLQKK